MADREKILLVDDSSTRRMIVKEILKEAGYEIFEAQDGVEGLKKAQVEDPDLIITDIQMPNMDGMEMVQLLKSKEETKYIPIICTSATYQDLEHKYQALMESGAEEYFYATQEENELLAKVKVMMRIRKIYLTFIEQNKELKQFNELVVEREIKMIELKDRVKQLEEELAQYRKQ